MITYFIDFVFILAILGIMAGTALLADGIRRLKERN
jgi:hypothetical protein